MRHTLLSLAILATAALVGCGTQAGQSQAPAKPAAKGGEKDPGVRAADAAAKKAAPTVDLKLASADEVFATIKQKTGKVVVVDCWTTYCEPCMKEFPGLLKIQEKHGDKVFCLSVCLNYAGFDKPEDTREEALKFLKEQKATIPNLLSSTADEAFFKAVQREFKLPDAPAGVPIILVFDREGKLAKRWDTTNIAEEKGFSYAKSVEPVVEKLLK
jgi:thiol-disulfide isomerase/thioredoxin